MATYHVAKTGNNSNNGTSLALARLTIQSGVSLLASGDTLEVHGGTYVEVLELGTMANGIAGNPTTIKSFGADDVIIRPNTLGSVNDVIRINNARAYLTIKGSSDAHPLVIDGINVPATLSQAEAVRIQDTSHHITCEYLEVKNHQYHGITNGGSGSPSPYNITVRHCHIHDNGLAWPGSNLIHGIYLIGRNALIEYNHVHHQTGGYGIHQYNQGSAVGEADDGIIRHNLVHNVEHRGILAGSGSNTRVYNNIIYDAGTTGIRIGFSGATNIQVYNNTIYSCGGFVVIENTSTGAIVRNNIGWANTNNAISNNGVGTVQSNNLTVNPLFINQAAFDFHLQAASPAVNFGTNLSAIFATDYDGVARPSSGAWEAGAYEFGGSPPDTTPPAVPTGLTVT